MQAIDVTKHSRITQQLVPSTTIFSFVCCSQFACKKKLLMTFGTTLVYCQGALPNPQKQQPIIGKLKFTLEQATKTERGSRDIALLFL